MTKATCAIDSCDRPVYRRHPWCHRHYRRWERTGDPLGVRRDKAPDGEPQAWLAIVAEAWWPVCIDWPYAKGPKGYGLVKWGGRDARVSRVLCELAHGSAPSPQHQAAHSCGHSWCVNWRHLAWKTQAQNEQDKRAHGTYTGRWKHPSVR